MDTIAITIGDEDESFSTIWNANPKPIIITDVQDRMGLDYVLVKDKLIKQNLLAWSLDKVVTNNTIDKMPAVLAHLLINMYIDYIIKNRIQVFK